LPRLAPAKRALAGELVMTTLSQVGKELSSSPRSNSEIRAYADAMADMFVAYLKKLEHSYSQR
jgi:hypothetical protein